MRVPWNHFGGSLVFAGLSGLVLQLSACNQLIGIEDAAVDPTLTPSEVTNGAGGTSAFSDDATGGDADASAVSSTTSAANPTSGSPKLGDAGAPSSDSTSDSGGAASTSATSSDTGASSGAGGSSQKEPPLSLCDSYCDDIMEVCTGAQLQYRDRAQCMAICSTFPEGELGQTNDNTVACRAKYAGDARYGSGTELQAYCRRAGPAGDGRCGSNCHGFCAIMMHVCTPEDAGVYHYESDQDCMDACEGLPNLPGGYSASDPTIADGNHVQCRIFHVMSAAMLDPEEHCEHAMGVTLCELVAE